MSLLLSAAAVAVPVPGTPPVLSAVATKRDTSGGVLVEGAAVQFARVPYWEDHVPAKYVKTNSTRALNASEVVREATRMNSLLPEHAWEHAPYASFWDMTPDYLRMMKRPALLLIDSQEMFRDVYGEAQVEDMKAIIDAFRARCLPIVFKLWTDRTTRRQACRAQVPLFEVSPTTMSEANRTVKYSKYDHFMKNPHLDTLLESWDVDTLIIIGGFSEHCILSAASAAYNRNFRVVIPERAIGPHLSHRFLEKVDASGRRVRSLQHEAALVAMQSAFAQIVPNASAVLARLTQADARGNVCADTPVAAPAPGYMKHAFRDQSRWCYNESDRVWGLQRAPYPPMKDIDAPWIGEWPLWAPMEAKFAAWCAAHKECLSRRVAQLRLAQSGLPALLERLAAGLPKEERENLPRDDTHSSPPAPSADATT